MRVKTQNYQNSNSKMLEITEEPPMLINEMPSKPMKKKKKFRKKGKNKKMAVAADTPVQAMVDEVDAIITNR